MRKRSDEIFDFTFDDDLTEVISVSLQLGSEGHGQGPRIPLDDVTLSLTVIEGAVTEVLGTRPGTHGWIESCLLEDSDLDGLFGAVVVGRVATLEATGLALQPFVIDAEGVVSRRDDDDSGSSAASDDVGSRLRSSAKSPPEARADDADGSASARRPGDDRPGNGNAGGIGNGNAGGNGNGGGSGPGDDDPGGSTSDAGAASHGPGTGSAIGAGQVLLAVDIDGTTYVVEFKARPFWADVDLYRDDNDDGSWTRVATFAGPEVAEWYDADAGTIDLTGIAALLAPSEGLVG